MIIWLASYPKSGNTWLRALISSYYYTKDGIFDANIIKKIGQFPEKRHFSNFNYDKNIVTDTSRFWIKAQEKINQEKKIELLQNGSDLDEIKKLARVSSKSGQLCLDFFSSQTVRRAHSEG